MTTKTNTSEKQLKPALQYADGLYRSRFFVDHLSEDPTNPARALGKTALDYVALAEEKSPYLDLDAQAVRLMGLLEEYVVAQTTLNSSGANMNDQDVNHYKLKTIHFNHALRELIDTNSRLTMGDVTEFVEASALVLRPSDGDFIVNAKELIRRSLRGMVQEIIAEDAIWQIEGVEEVDHANEEQERKGADLVVTRWGNKLIIDVKSSGYAANNRNEQNDRHNTPTNEIALWSGVATDELEGRLRATPEQMQQSIQYLSDRLVPRNSLPQSKKSIA